MPRRGGSCSGLPRSLRRVTGTPCSDCLNGGTKGENERSSMSESIKWSFSADRCARRCQRQFFLQHKAAWHTTRDPVRREAFLLKQVKTLELWQGTLVHRAIELHVVPALRENRPVDWELVSDQA